ncbi:SbcC/MukB-like Walker B domain-containing protein [Companilactobacillus hulinensis]|uniref:SbcC/MukB-like Walker B domain-containing protein n=1 Tax=Companilactobacillus hulinensis TaxID=2486007 RepID=UPI000F7BAFEB|nr:SMC family ATPase [Companilactobacillus hulinensis]
MKPVYLEMNYFGPHEHSIIDFRRLEEAPIFLIGGDTGAGKSTIFDAMTFALFGSTTSDRDAKEMRSQFAPDNGATSVIFYFEQGNNLYKVERTPEQRLEKSRGKGLTNKKPTATLGIVEKVGGAEIQSIAGKPVDVGTEIADILKLNADQFKKIILLPQNDFSEFLKAKTDDKVSILKRIFGTQIFDDFTDALKAKYDDAKKQNTGFETEINTQITAMNLDESELETLKHEADDQKVIILEKFVAERKSQMAEAQSEADITNKALTKADQELKAATDIQKKFERLDELKAQFKTDITDKQADVEESIKHVAELNWANELKDIIRDLDRTNGEQKHSLDDKNAIETQLSSAKKQNADADENLTILTDKQSNIDAKNKRVDSLSNLIPLVSRREELTHNLALVQPQIETISAEITKQTKTSDDLRTQIASKQANLISTETLQKQKDDLLHEKDNFVETLSPIKTRQDSITHDISKLQSKLIDAKSEVEIRQNKLETAKEDYQQKIGTRQSLMIAQLQQELVDGQPCVVCGSTVHPNVSHEVVANEGELKKSIDDVDTSQKNFAAAEQNLKTAQKNLTEITKQLDDSNKELISVNEQINSTYVELTSSSKIEFPGEFDLDTIKKIFNTKTTEIDSNLATAAKLAKEIDTLENSLKKNEQAISDNQLKLTGSKSKQTTYQNDLADLTAKITEGTKSGQELTTEQADLKQEITEFNSQLEASKTKVHQSEVILSNGQTQLKDINDQLEKQINSIDKLQNNLDTALQSKDAKTSDITTLKSWITEINDGINNKLNETISSYNKEKEMLNADIKKVTAELIDAKVPDIDQLQQVLNTQKEANNLAVTKAAQLKLTYDNISANFKKIKQIIKNQSSFGKKLAEITSLYNIVNGKDGNDDKLKLETFVVQNYLRKVLDYANHNFINLLSNNRYSFEIAEQGSDKRTDHGLDINVYDNETGATRSSDTLSGGETFIAALSIALSLSEVVQSSANGVKIDALFIDEGFGSLDHETLGKSMTALETIGENRMVGVISHIETMKATIGQQVLIKKVGDGRSTVEIVTK